MNIPKSIKNICLRIVGNEWVKFTINILKLIGVAPFVWIIRGLNRIVVDVSNWKDRRLRESQVKRQLLLNQLVNEHVNVLFPAVNTLFLEAYSIIYARDVQVYVANKISYIEYDGPEFLLLTQKFFDQLKIVSGSVVYRSLIKSWGSESLFQQYVVIWLYTKILNDLAVKVAQSLPSSTID